MLTPKEIFQSIRRFQMKVLKNVNNLFIGVYRSKFKGKGLEFEEVREYQPGDDIRSIDWNVSARLQHLFVKNFHDEREITIMLVVDVSASTRFSHTHRLKSEIIAELAALVAFSAIKNQDKVGLLLFTDEIELYLKPKKEIQHVLRVIRELLCFSPKYKQTNISEALSFLGRVQKKRVVCFLISDFLTANFSKEAAIIAKRHELIAFHVFDTYERSFLPKGLFTLHDLENYEQAIIDTADPDVRQHFEKNAQKQASDIQHLFKSIGADYLAMNTEESSCRILQRFFGIRGCK